MKKIIFKILFIVSILTFVSCTGTGTKTSMLFKEVETEETKIFIKRSTGFAGVAALIKVKLNDIILGDLGEDEAFTAIPKIGFNNLSVGFTMLASIATIGGVNTFEIEEGEKLFFIIRQDMLGLSSKLKIYNVDKTYFFSD